MLKWNNLLIFPHWELIMETAVTANRKANATAFVHADGSAITLTMILSLNNKFSYITYMS